MTANVCTLHIQTKSDSCSVNEIIAQQVLDNPPQLAWAEPNPLHVKVTNRTGQRDDFVSLQLGHPSWPIDLPLIEARLFWPNAALHVVASDGGGCIWTRIAESETAELHVMRSTIRVHTRSDWERFGLNNSEAIKNLQAIEYRERGRLVAWRLIIEGMNNVD
jgi:hypothetical protein